VQSEYYSFTHLFFSFLDQKEKEKGKDLKKGKGKNKGSAHSILFVSHSPGRMGRGRMRGEGGRDYWRKGGKKEKETGASTISSSALH